jgi:hypothetical protein
MGKNLPRGRSRVDQDAVGLVGQEGAKPPNFLSGAGLDKICVCVVLWINPLKTWGDRP